MHVRARDDSEVFYKHLKKKFKQIRPVVSPESCRQVEKIVFLETLLARRARRAFRALRKLVLPTYAIFSWKRRFLHESQDFKLSKKEKKEKIEFLKIEKWVAPLMQVT